MPTVYFFYGLAFIALAVIIFTSFKKNDFLCISKDVRLIGFFGLIHGINEWVELLIQIGKPFSVESLWVISSMLLPVSFLCLVAFGGRVISRERPALRFLNSLWVVCLFGWFLSYFLEKDLLHSSIAARYFIAIPGTLLSGAAIYIKFYSVGAENLPIFVRRSVYFAGPVFFLYGFFSGLVVPQADFLLSSMINYPRFMHLTGIPVQVFRMVCALALAVCFFGISGVLYYENEKVRWSGGIRRKVTFLICASVALVITIGAGLLYYFGYNILHSMIGKDYTKMSRLLETYVSDSIRQELGNAKSYSDSPLWKKQIIAANEKYANMSAEAREAYFKDMDRKWAEAAEGSQVLNEYLGNYLASRLKALSDDDPDIGEIFVTDRLGGLAASSRKTSDFYQADEDWWKETYADGKGKPYVGNIEFDESSKQWGITLAVPIRGENGDIVGIYKAFMEAAGFFNFIDDFKVGVTGHAALINKDGYVIFLHGVRPMSEKFCAGECLENLCMAGSGYLVSDSLFGYRDKVFVAYSDVPSYIFSGKETGWKIVIMQDAKEVFAPIDNFVFLLVVIWTGLLVFMIPLGLAVGSVFAKPIHDLHIATEKIMNGESDYDIDIRTGDEIEQFSYTFKDMVSNIEKRQAELLYAKEELEQLSRDLEKKVKGRTKELSETQVATLNILEDLSKEKEKVEKYSRELEDALRIKSDFTSMVSHELRTPLMAIKEGISLVSDGTAGKLNKDQKEFLDIAKRNVDRLTRLINDVLELQRLEAGKLYFNVAPNDTNGAVNEVCDMMATMFKDKALAIELRLDRKLPPVAFDKDKIIQVLMNLINNALKFTEKGGITITTQRESNTVMVSVRDTGPGIRPADIPRLFKRFEQLDTGTERKPGGTGLGLAISKEIIELHGGKIWVESVFGEGTTFSFNLPIIERRGSQ